MQYIAHNQTPATGTGNQSEPALTSVRRFRADLNIVSSTFYRWEKRGWIGKPLNIGGRLYLSRDQIADFKRRAEAGEFAVNIKPGPKGDKAR